MFVNPHLSLAFLPLRPTENYSRQFELICGFDKQIYSKFIESISSLKGEVKRGVSRYDVSIIDRGKNPFYLKVFDLSFGEELLIKIEFQRDIKPKRNIPPKVPLHSGSSQMSKFEDIAVLDVHLMRGDRFCFCEFYCTMEDVLFCQSMVESKQVKPFTKFEIPDDDTPPPDIENLVNVVSLYISPNSYIETIQMGLSALISAAWSYRDSKYWPDVGKVIRKHALAIQSIDKIWQPECCTYYEALLRVVDRLDTLSRCEEDEIRLVKYTHTSPTLF